MGSSPGGTRGKLLSVPLGGVTRGHTQSSSNDVPRVPIREAPKVVVASFIENQSCWYARPMRLIPRTHAPALNPEQKQAFAVNHSVRINQPGHTGKAWFKFSDVQKNRSYQAEHSKESEVIPQEPAHFGGRFLFRM